MHALFSANNTKGIAFFRHDKVLSDFTIAKQDVTIQIHVENSKTTTHLPILLYLLTNQIAHQGF